MIKIVHLITDLDVGGAEVMLARLVGGMNRGRFHNQVVSLVSPGPIGGKIQKSGIVLNSLEMRQGIPHPRAIARLYRILRKERPDILQTWLYHADLLGLIVGTIAGIPNILWNIRCSDMDMRQYSVLTRLVRWMLTKISSTPISVVANSEAGRQFHERLGYRPRQWKIIPNGIDRERFSPDLEARTKLREELNLPLDVLLIGLLSRFDPKKDHKNFLTAAKSILQTYPHTHFVLAGRGVDPHNSDLIQIIHELEIGENVHLLGERRDVELILAGLDILSSSSSFGEGFPNIVGEAMACGIPCAVTDVGDSAWVVSDSGKVVKPRDPKALARAFEELILLGGEGRQILGSAAQKRIREYFDLATVVSQYENFYEDLVNRRGTDT